MTLVPLTECCLRLGIDPKTLRLWLKAAQLSCCLHPHDARLKCVTLSQLQHLAELHGRPLPSCLPETASQAVAVSTCTVGTAPNGSPASSKPDEASLRQQVQILQQQVSTLQAQVTDLALLLVRSHLAPGCPPAPAVLPSLAVSLAPCPPSPIPPTAKERARLKVPLPHNVASALEPPRARSRALPLIQVRPDGSVVVIAPNEGVLPLLPDSAAWFAWLSSLTAFTFEGQHDRFSATRKFRDGQRVQSWNVHRSLHGRSCTLYLGLTPTLTLARLQEMAAAVHARLSPH